MPPPAESDSGKSDEDIQKYSPYLTLAESTNGTGDVPCNKMSLLDANDTTGVATGKLKPGEIQIIDANANTETVLQKIPLYFLTYGCIWKDGFIYYITNNKNDDGFIVPGNGSADELRMISLTDAMTEDAKALKKTQPDANDYCNGIKGWFLPTGFDFVGRQEPLIDCGTPGYDNIKDNLSYLLSGQCKESNPEPSTCLSGDYWSITTAPAPSTTSCGASSSEGYSIDFGDSAQFELIWESNLKEKKVRCASSYNAPDSFSDPF